ncbi:helix-turn-helix domain-containing protein [Sphingomonas crocodyli]|uniref:DNA-binding protein n=1 Tax=Sphingomonas crocodyli TaxID=1979270 RepID=A0A437M628_9SPHN|nr:helix-turn-helix domain-containing protein [Sphingomonas crocodyli]RVT92996.1 DNA-binding protein [Sphingomonas crocodyli]
MANRSAFSRCASVTGAPVPFRVREIVLSPTEVEQVFGVTAKKLAALRRAGNGPQHLKVGRYYMYRPASVAQWLIEVGADEQRDRSDEGGCDVA